MEANKVDSVRGDIGSSSEGRPPNPLAGAYRQCFSTPHGPTPCKKSLVRHQSLQVKELAVPIEQLSVTDCEVDFLPIVRSGAWADIGFRSSMEDVYVCLDDGMHHYGLEHISKGPYAFYGGK